MKKTIKLLAGIGLLGLGGTVQAQTSMMLPWGVDVDTCSTNVVTDLYCDSEIPELQDVCEYTQSYLGYVKPLCETTVDNFNDAVANLISRGYVRIGKPTAAQSSENCPTGARFVPNFPVVGGDEVGCLSLTTQVLYSARLDQSVLLCAAYDPYATKIDIACGGGSGVNIAPLAFGRVIQATADGSNVQLQTTVTSHDLDGPLRSVEVSNRMDPSTIVSGPNVPIDIAQ